MATAQVKSIMPGVSVRAGKRGSTIRFCCMVNGRRFSKTCELPYEEMVTERGAPTRELKSEYNRWVGECTLHAGRGNRGTLRTPTIRELIDAYSEIASKRQADPRFRKSERTIDTAIKNFGYCLAASGLRDNKPYKELVGYDMIRKIANKFVSDKSAGGFGLSSISAWSYIAALQSVTAKWSVVEYRDMGYIVEPVTIPKQSLFGVSADPKQYEELPRETVSAIWEWYLNAQENESPQFAIYVTCMLELAMRPGDVGRLTADNFPVSVNGHHRLVYKPGKTRESSNRRVDIELPDALYERLVSLAPEAFEGDGGALVPNLRSTEDRVNASLRKIPGLGDKQKASYELRKLCVHTILVTPLEQGGGVDQAVRLSGDRRETIEKYYCDPYKSHVALPLNALGSFLERQAQ